MSASDNPILFDQLVAVLEPTFRSVAPFILTRLLLRARVFDRAAMSVAELQRALPILEGGLAESSLTPSQLAAILSGVNAVVRRNQGDIPLASTA